MRRFLSVLCLPALLLACSAANPAQPVAKPLPKNNSNKTLLWRISGNGLTKTSYLFGTMHMICPDDYLWTDSMKIALNAVDKVCFEMDMDDPAVLQASMAGLSMGDDKSSKKGDNKPLKDYYTPAEYAKIKKFMKDSLNISGMQFEMYANMKPMMVQMLMETKTIDCMIPVSYEANIMDDAKKAHKEILGLEQPEEQLAVLNGVNSDTAADGLLQMVDSFGATRRQFRNMVATYKDQDLPALFDQVHGSKEVGNDMGAFLDDRNKKWIPRMAVKMKANSIFFAVGAGHLWGTQGVISLLRKAGYTVEPIYSQQVI